MTTASPDSSLPWHGLSQPDYIAMKNAWLDYWRPVLPTVSLRRVLTEIVRYQNYQTGASFRGHQRIAADLGYAPKTVQRAVAELERVGLLTVSRLRDAPRTAQGMLVSPRWGGRANHYGVDYNTVRMYDGSEGEGKWHVGSSDSVGELSKALRRAQVSGESRHGALPAQTSSSECPPNVVNGLNVLNASNTTSMDAAERGSKANRDGLRSRLVVTTATTAEDLQRAYPAAMSERGIQDWCLNLASVFAVRVAEEWPDAPVVDVEVLAGLFARALTTHSRTVVGSATVRWLQSRQGDATMINPAAVFYRNAETYFAQAAVDAASDAEVLRPRDAGASSKDAA